MELKEFIKTSLIQIISAVHEAKLEISTSNASQFGAEITPHVSTPDKVTNLVPLLYSEKTSGTANYAQIIDFDVAVTAAETQEISGKIGGKLVVLNTTLDGKSESSLNTVSRIKFSIPVSLSQTSLRVKKP